MIDLTSDDFQDSGITYLGLTLWDSPLCNILPHLGVAADYINTVLSANKKIMVSCQMGVSRSASCVMAYMMVYQDMPAMEALRAIRRSRDVRPNDGFLEQLILLDTDLRQEPEQRLIRLGTVRDTDQLPKPWNYEFFVGSVTEDEVGTPLVHLGQECPLRLSGFSSLNETPSYSNSVSRREARFSRHGYHQDSRSRSCDILEETDDDLETCDELEAEEADLPILERVKEIITEPEETWRYSDLGQDSWQGASTTKPELIQPPPEADLLSLIKVSSAAEWKSISTNLEIDLSPDLSPDLSLDLPTDLPREQDKALSPAEDITSKQVLAVCWQIKPWECPKESFTTK